MQRIFQNLLGAWELIVRSKMEICNSNDTVCADESERPSFRGGIVCSKIQNVFSAWLKTFVIKKSSENKEEWHFRTMFVAEITILPVVLSFVFIFWWAVNRNVRLRKTKGSFIPIKEERQEDDGNFDNEDDDYHDDVNSIDGVQDDLISVKDQRPMRRRKEMQALLKAYTVELDNDECDDETVVSLESYSEESDCEEGPPCSNSPTSNISSTKADRPATELFLSKEKLNLWKVVKEIPIFSFFNEEAMEICMNDVEYINLSEKDDFFMEGRKIRWKSILCSERTSTRQFF